jgi:hypothetical protein
MTSVMTGRACRAYVLGMGAHLYVCDNGGPMVVATDGAPPRWVTCPACNIVDCSQCKGAQLQGGAEDFEVGASAVYRCPSGHEQMLRMPVGKDLPESAQCSRCDGMLLPKGGVPARN